KLDVSKFGSPVRAVSSFRDRRVPGRVRLIAELSRPATPTFDRAGGVLHWRFAGTDALAKRAGGKPQAVPVPVVGGFGATSTPIAQQSVAQVPPQPGRRRIYRGATITLEVKDAPLHDLMRLIAD